MKPPGVQIAADAWWGPLVFHYTTSTLHLEPWLLEPWLLEPWLLWLPPVPPVPQEHPQGAMRSSSFCSWRLICFINSTSFLSWIGETSRVCPLLNGGPSRRPSDGGWALCAGKSIPNKA